MARWPVYAPGDTAPTGGTYERLNVFGGIVRVVGRIGYGRLPDMTMSYSYRGFGYRREIIRHAVRLYHCFSLSLCEVELILVDII
jgi:hypothetical protein